MNGNCCAASDGTELTSRKNPESPAIVPAPPKASANPTAQYASEAIEKLVRILATPAPAFLARENPISNSAKPACMNITSTAATITQVVFRLETVSSRVGPSCANATAGSASSTAAPESAAFKYLVRFKSVPPYPPGLPPGVAVTERLPA